MVALQERKPKLLFASHWTALRMAWENWNSIINQRLRHISHSVFCLRRVRCKGSTCFWKTLLVQMKDRKHVSGIQASNSVTEDWITRKVLKPLLTPKDLERQECAWNLSHAACTACGLGRAAYPCAAAVLVQTSADVWILNSCFPLQVLKIAYTVQNIRLLLPLSVLDSKRRFSKQQTPPAGSWQRAAGGCTLTQLCISPQRIWPFPGASDLWYGVSGHFCTVSMLLQENEWNWAAW